MTIIHCRGRRPLTLGLFSIAVFACSPAGDSTGALPPNIPDPATVKTSAGAVAFYRQVLREVPSLFDPLVVDVGVLTDELAALPVPPTFSTAYTPVDSRQDLSGLGKPHSDRLHRLRAQAREARGFLAAYAPDSSPALRGHLYALEGYAEVFLADLFCSGIPLSTVDFNGDYTLAAGSTTSEVYTHAVALFDSALALSGDSLRLQQMAAVGRGRALLALGRYADAAAAVAAVPDGYQYPVAFSPTGSSGDILQGFTAHNNGGQYADGTPSVGNREGNTGLDYRTSGDPRTPAALLGQDQYGHDLYFPAKYPQSGSIAFIFADAVEARLIEAEAALALDPEGTTWLTKLNALRTDGTYDTQPNADDPNQTDTLWRAGTAGVAGLRPLDDPGDAGARIDLVFRERAFWLYLTAHRQGDLRRLLRQHPDRGLLGVYPTGTYPGGNGLYGTAMVVPVPESERELNPKYTGCLNGNP